MGIDLDASAFFTDAVKCLPPGNRTPLQSERRACTPFLRREMEILRPRRALTFGRPALEAFLEAAGRSDLLPTGPVAGWLPARIPGSFPLLALPHPAYAMRQKRAYVKRYRSALRCAFHEAFLSP